MKRNPIWGLGLALTLGCWVEGASARPLIATGSLLVPYYEAQGNLATLIGVQHVGAQANGVSIINVTVHDPDGEAAAGGYICLGPNEFGYVVLQNAQPPLDEDFGIYFSVARDAIDRTGFVGLAYAGYRNSCSDGAGTIATASANVMTAWAVLQDVGSGFFATEVPVVQVGWEAGAAARPAKGLVPYCRGSDNSTRYDSPAVVNATNKSCTDPDTRDDVTYTFVASGPYCYLNTDANRANVDATVKAQDDLQINAARTGCADEFTHTFVRANTELPAIPAAGPRADISEAGHLANATDADGCDAANDNDPATANDCPGLTFNAANDQKIGARFDVLSSNRSVSNVYLWLDTAPLDGRDVQEDDFTIVCEDGTEPTLTASQLNRIDIDDHVTVINPSGMGCSGRGVLELKLPERAVFEDFCYDRSVAAMTPIRDATILDDRNNRCYSFARKRNTGQTQTDQGDSYFCYNSTNISSSNAVVGDRVPAAEITNSESSTPDVVTSCRSYTYVKDVTADSPSGYMFSHISQADAHFRMNFPGYEK